jgi:hypothetical protein
VRVLAADGIAAIAACEPGQGGRYGACGSGCVAVAAWQWQWQWQFRISGIVIAQFTFFSTLTHFKKNPRISTIFINFQCNFVQFSMQLCPIFGQFAVNFRAFSGNFGVIS